MNTNIYGDFQICISVPLNTSFIRAFLLYATTFLVLLFFGTNQSEGLGASVLSSLKWLDIATKHCS